MTYFIRVHNQHCFAVNLFDLFWGNQVSHTHWFPARLPFPKHSVHGGQQGADVTLLPLDPVQNLGHREVGKLGSRNGGNSGQGPDLKQLLTKTSLSHSGSGETSN